MPPRSLCSPRTMLGTASPVAALVRCRRSSRSPPRSCSREGTTSTPAKPTRFARAKVSSSPTARRTSCMTPALTSASGGLPGNLLEGHRSGAFLRRLAGGERHPQRQEVVASRVERLPILGDRAHELAERSREAVRVPGALERVAGGDAVALELEEIGVEQHAAANRSLGPV